MDIHAARAFYAANSSGEHYRYDATGLVQITDLFEASDAAGRERIWDAFAAFAREGGRVETTLAESFFANDPPPAHVYAGFAAALLAGGHPNAAVLERILGDSRARLGDADRQALTTLFIADPTAHFALAPSLVKRAPQGPAWDAYVLVLKTATDPALLAFGLEAAYLAMREDDYFKAFIGRPPELIDALAERLPSSEGDRLRAAVCSP